MDTEMSKNIEEMENALNAKTGTGAILNTTVSDEEKFEDTKFECYLDDKEKELIFDTPLKRSITKLESEILQKARELFHSMFNDFVDISIVPKYNDLVGVATFRLVPNSMRKEYNDASGKDKDCNKYFLDQIGADLTKCNNDAMMVVMALGLQSDLTNNKSASSYCKLNAEGMSILKEYVSVLGNKNNKTYDENNNYKLISNTTTNGMHNQKNIVCHIEINLARLVKELYVRRSDYNRYNVVFEGNALKAPYMTNGFNFTNQPTAPAVVGDKCYIISLIDKRIERQYSRDYSISFNYTKQ